MALSSGLSRLCNTKVQLHRSDFWLPSRTQNQLHPDPPHALPLDRGNDPHGAGTPKAAGLFLLIYQPQGVLAVPTQGPAPSTSHTPRLKHSLKTPGNGLQPATLG